MLSVFNAGIQNEVQNNGYTLVLMNGDLSYADGYLCKSWGGHLLLIPVKHCVVTEEMSI